MTYLEASVEACKSKYGLKFRNSSWILYRESMIVCEFPIAVHGPFAAEKAKQVLREIQDIEIQARKEVVI